MTVADVGYGRQFEGWYDRVFPDDESARATVDGLVLFHPDPVQGTLEFGVGTGRIALPLSRRVGPVTGVDSSTQMLAALEKKGEAGEVSGVLGDISGYRDGRQYGLVYCVCSTLAQLLDPEAQRQAVARAADCLRPGGRLVIETHNRPGIVAQHEGRTRSTFFVPYPEANTGLQMHTTLLHDNQLWHSSTMWFESDGTHRIGTEIVRLLTPEETDGYARDAGLRPEGHYGDWARAPYDPAAGVFIASYTKPA